MDLKTFFSKTARAFSSDYQHNVKVNNPELESVPATSHRPIVK
jgi:hypothetical protein